ncbi:hypothetical protein A9762_16755 [Pandoraea sp. ISTKB]|nr:hypothetical protein A9762_16755 [Pandoraea sp. ISTKB]
MARRVSPASQGCRARPVTPGFRGSPVCREFREFRGHLMSRAIPPIRGTVIIRIIRDSRRCRPNRMTAMDGQSRRRHPAYLIRRA